jgi:hypothetical protein
MGREHCLVGESVLCRQHHSGMGSAKAWVLLAQVYRILRVSSKIRRESAWFCGGIYYLFSLCGQIKTNQNTVIETSINNDSTEYMCTVY